MCKVEPCVPRALGSDSLLALEWLDVDQAGLASVGSVGSGILPLRYTVTSGF